MLFYGSANPTGKNPDEVCQLFSVNERGGDLRQLTATRGLTTDPDGTVHDEYPGPVAFP